jgi:hypothetical protein
MPESVYSVNSPYCVFKFEKEEWNIGEFLGKFKCLKEDPRKETGVTCRSAVGDTPMTCDKLCSQN